jgi:hypothetical protein
MMENSDGSERLRTHEIAGDQRLFLRVRTSSAFCAPRRLSSSSACAYSHRSNSRGSVSPCRKRHVSRVNGSSTRHTSALAAGNQLVSADTAHTLAIGLRAASPQLGSRGTILQGNREGNTGRNSPGVRCSPWIGPSESASCSDQRDSRTPRASHNCRLFCRLHLAARAAVEAAGNSQLASPAIGMLLCAEAQARTLVRKQTRTVADSRRYMRAQRLGAVHPEGGKTAVHGAANASTTQL